jgi:hypothetical protein
MPNADFSTWTPAESIAEKIASWIQDPQFLVHGGLYSCITENSNTKYALVDHQ